MDEIGDITDYIQDEAGSTADIIWGNCTDESLGEKVSVTVIATGFGANNTDSFDLGKKPEKVIMTLDDESPNNIATELTDNVAENTADSKNEVEEPTLKVTAKEQPKLNFEPKAPVAEETIEEPTTERVVFKLDENKDELEAKTKEATWNWGAKEIEDTLTNEEVTSIKSTLEEEEEAPEAAAQELPEEVREEITFTKKEINVEKTPVEGPVYTNRLPDEEQLKRSQERIMKIKELGMRMKTPSGINDLENEPAYKRRKINLDEVTHSSENPISRFTLSNDEDGKPKLNDDNSFLHDNVD
jgi:cell division protein FtsZ